MFIFIIKLKLLKNNTQYYNNQDYIWGVFLFCFIFVLIFFYIIYIYIESDKVSSNRATSALKKPQAAKNGTSSYEMDEFRNNNSSTVPLLQMEAY